MVKGRRHSRRSWFDWAVFVSGVTPHFVYWGSGAVLGIVALVRLAHGEPAPPYDALMQTDDDWPPVILPSWPFWASMPMLVIGVARSRAFGLGRRESSWQPWLVPSLALFAGADGILFALAFWETPEWPRDSAVPGVILMMTGVVGLTALVVRVFAATRRARRARGRQR